MAAASPAATLSRIPFDTVPSSKSGSSTKSTETVSSSGWPKTSARNRLARDHKIAIAKRFRDRALACLSPRVFRKASGNTELPTNNPFVVSPAYWGRMTVSITWITPLLAGISVVTTVALST